MAGQSSSLYERTEAGEKFDTLQRRARLSQLWSGLTRRGQPLLCMEGFYRRARINHAYYAGVQSVPVSAIRGSVGRCGDFDVEFRPLRSHNRERWINIAVAREQEMPLPAVDLVRVNDTYFVVDGHHRVSVAKARGQFSIDANVIEWQVA